MRTRIAYTIEADSGIIVGSTSEILQIGIDRGAMRGHLVAFNASNETLESNTVGPVIPGSSIKGKVRDQCERILRSIVKDSSFCEPPNPRRMCAPGRPACALCELFGGPATPSRVFFADASCRIPQQAIRFSTKVQAGVSLSRRRRIAEDERLFFQERAVEGLIYQGAIDGHLDPRLADRQLALIVVGLERIVAVGGGKSRGSGWSSIKIVDVVKDAELISGDRIQSLREALTQWIQ
jgi:CRISPR/Cas system CSM-associated protein Csm3 (group 7 of RAMP superfamily)